jgi:hypothetical protein
MKNTVKSFQSASLEHLEQLVNHYIGKLPVASIKSIQYQAVYNAGSNVTYHYCLIYLV